MKKKAKYNVAIVGVTGAVGEEFIKTLENRKFPVDQFIPLASKNSVGKKVTFNHKEYAVQELTENSFANVDIALFSAGGAQSKAFAKIAAKAGAVVIDNSSAFRMDPAVPLVVPEVNPQDAFKHQGIIANPNCTTIIMAVAIFPIHQINPIKRIVVTSYQAVSGAGAKALEELKIQQEDLLSGKQPKAHVFKHVIANNIFSHDSTIQSNGYAEEELKMVNETRKIFGTESIQISPTCIRVPIYRAHSEAIHLDLSHAVDLKQVYAVLEKASGIKIVDDREKNYFPMPLDVTGKEEVLVGRIRQDLDLPNGLNLFVSGDQLLKGAALNAVQIAELLIQ